MNKVILVGTISHPPRYSPEGQWPAVLNIMVTSEHRYKDAEGEIVERSQTLKAALWGKLAELNADVQKGQLVALEGRLQNRKVTGRDGPEHWETSIVANAFEVLHDKHDPEAQQQDAPKQQQQPPEGFSDDDIPF